MVADRDESPTLGAEIGARIRSHRTRAGLSGVQLAANSEVSQPFLSQLESGQSSVGIATLYRIARALRVHPSDLLPPPSPADVEIARAGEVPRTGWKYTGTATRRVGFRSNSRLSELHDCRISISDGAGAEEIPLDAETILYVLEGAVRLEFEDGSETTLGEGDAACCRGWLPCRFRPAQEARLILIVAAD